MKPETVTLTRVYTSDKKKDGTPLISKKGKPYTKLSIQTSEYGAAWLSGFQNKSNSGWKEGDKVEIIVEKKGEYLNFSMPDMKNAGFAEGEKILNKLTEMSLLQLQIAEKVGINIYKRAEETPTAIPYPDDDIDADDIPF